MTDTTMGSTDRSDRTQSMGDLSVIEQPCGIEVARIVRGHKIGVGENRWYDIRLIWIGWKIPEGVEHLDIPLGIGTQSVFRHELRDIFTPLPRTNVDCHSLRLEVASEFLGCDFATPLGIICG